MAGHDDEVELPLPVDRGEVAEDPLDVGAGARLIEHRVGGVEPAQPAAVATPGLAQQVAGAAADIEHRRADITSGK